MLSLSWEIEPLWMSFSPDSTSKEERQDENRGDSVFHKKTSTYYLVPTQHAQRMWVEVSDGLLRYFRLGQ